MFKFVNSLIDTALSLPDEHKSLASSISVSATVAFSLSGKKEFQEISDNANIIIDSLGNNQRKCLIALGSLSEKLTFLIESNKLEHSIAEKLKQYDDSKNNPSVENPFTCEEKIIKYNGDTYSCMELSEVVASSNLKIYDDKVILDYLTDNGLPKSYPYIQLFKEDSYCPNNTKIFLACIETCACYIYLFDILQVNNISCIDKFFAGVQNALNSSLVFNRMNVENSVNIFKAYSIGVSNNIYTDLHDKSELLDTRQLIDIFFELQMIELDSDNVIISKSHLETTFSNILQKNIEKISSEISEL